MTLSGSPEVTETARLADMMDKLFDCLNVSSFTAGKHARKPFQDPWRTNDFRLKVSSYKCIIMILVDILTRMQWLEEFLPYLAGWEASVQGRKGFSIAEQNKMMLSAETRLGLQFTGIAVL